MYIIQKIIQSLIESIIRNISGKPGRVIRSLYYRKIFKSCGKNIVIDEGVIFINPQNISIGSNVWISPYTIIIARSEKSKIDTNERKTIKKVNKNFKYSKPHIYIGNNVSIGPYNCINGESGIVIGDYFTSSARVSIYAGSHNYNDPNEPSLITYANCMANNENISCIESPIVIGKNVWLALNVIMLGGTIGNNSFITANSLVIKNIPENSYASGNPARKIKSRFIDKD